MAHTSPFCQATHGSLRCVSYTHEEGTSHDFQPASSVTVRSIQRQEELDNRLDPDTPSERILAARRLDSELASAQDALASNSVKDEGLIQGKIDTGKTQAAQMMGVEQVAGWQLSESPNYNYGNSETPAQPYMGTNGIHGSEFPAQARQNAIAEQIIENREAIVAEKEPQENIHAEAPAGPGEGDSVQNTEPSTNTTVVEKQDESDPS